MADFPLTLEELEAQLQTRAQQTGRATRKARGFFAQEPSGATVHPFFEQGVERQAVNPDRNPFILLLDFVSSAGYAVAGLVSGITDYFQGEAAPTEALSRFGRGLTQWWTGDPEARYVFADWLEDIGWEPEGIVGKVARGALGFVMDVALDPVSWMSFGISKSAAKVGGLTLNELGKKMLRGFRNRTLAREILETGGAKATREAVTKLTQRAAREKGWSKILTELPEGAKRPLLHEVNERAQKRLLPLVQGPLGDDAAKVLAETPAGLDKLMKTTGRSRELLEDVLLATGRGADDKAIKRLASRGLLDYADKGGIKWLGRTFIRSKTVDRLGLAYDAALSKYLIDPIARKARKAGQLLGVAPMISAAAKGAAKLKTKLKRNFGRLFNYDLLLEDEVARTIYKDFAKGEVFHRHDIFQAMLDKAAIKDETGKFLRWINPKETTELQRAMHNMSYYSHPLIGKPERAAKILDDLPPMLQEKVRAVRGFLDEALPLDALQGLKYQPLPNYFPQKWPQKAYDRLSARTDVRLGRHDWWTDRREILMPYDQAVKHGLDQNFWQITYDRVWASRDRALQQALVENYAQKFGERRLDVAGRQVIETMTDEARKAQGITVLDEAVEIAEGSPIRTPDLNTALEKMSSARERLTKTDILQARRDIRSVTQKRIRMRKEIIDSNTASDTAKASAKREITELERGLKKLDTVTERLEKRSINRWMRDQVKHPPGTPPPSAYKTEGPQIRKLGGQIKKSRRQLLESFVEGVEKGDIQFKGDLAALKADLEAAKKVSLAAPHVSGSREGIPSVKAAELDRHAEMLRTLGMPAKAIDRHVGDLRAFARTIQEGVEQYDSASKMVGKWQRGKMALDTPEAKGLMRQRIDQMQVVEKQVENLEANYDQLYGAVTDELKAIKKGKTPSHKESLELLQRVQESKVKRDALIIAKKNMRRPEELRAWRAFLEDPRAQKDMLKAPGAVADNVSAVSHKPVRLPVTRGQIETLERVFMAEGLSRRSAEILNRVADVKRWEDLTGQQAQELLDMVRRRPQDLLGRVKVPSREIDEMVPFPRLARDFVMQWKGEWINPRELRVPRWAAEGLVEILQRKKNGPIASRLLSVYDWAHDTFRWSVTVPWFAFQFRNSADAVLRTIFDGAFGALKPQRLVEFLRTLSGSTRPIRTAFGEIPRESLKRMMFEENLWRRWPARVDMQYGAPGTWVGQIIEMLAGPFGKRPNAKDIAMLNSHRLFSVIERAPVIGKFSKFFKRYTHASADLENALIHSFALERLDKGWTLGQIAHRAREFMFSWESLTHFERQTMRRLFPFYGFMRTAIPYTYQLIKEKPVIVGAIGKLRLLGGRDEDIAPYVPKFVQEAVSFRIPTTKGAKPHYLVLNNFLTIDWSRDWAMADTNAFMRAALGNMSPLITWPLERAFGKDLYFGRDIKERQILNRTYSQSPAIRPIYWWLKARPVKKGKRDYIAVDGQRLHDLRSFVFGRVYSSLDQMARAGLASEETLLRLGMGIISYQIDESRQRDLLQTRALHMQNEFKRAVSMGDDVRARQIWDEMRGD